VRPPRHNGGPACQTRQRLVKGGPIEIRPEAGHEDEFRIGRLPQQEIGKPLLAAGADHQIRIGYPGGVDMAGEGRFRDRGRIHVPGPYRLGDLANRTHHFVAGTVVEGDDEANAGVVTGAFLGIDEKCLDIWLDRFPAADNPDTDIFTMQLGKVLADEEPQQPHQVGDFLLRPVPVLR
jgi:hypothetical protein